MVETTSTIATTPINLEHKKEQQQQLQKIAKTSEGSKDSITITTTTTTTKRITTIISLTISISMIRKKNKVIFRRLKNNLIYLTYLNGGCIIVIIQN
jgi:hypothetical protein